MNVWRTLASAAVFCCTVSVLPAAAQVFGDAPGWPLFSFHEYGGDVNRPGATPDRPYWHGDDAVPLGLRWQDLEAAQAEAAAEDASVAAAAAASVGYASPRERRVRHAVHRRRASGLASSKRNCVPVIARNQ